MGLSLRIEPRDTYLYVVLTGAFSLPEAKTLSLRILDACVEHRITKVLVDVHAVSGPISVMERFDYAEFLSQKHLEYVARKLPPARFAYVGTEPIIDPGRFGETVAVNRGMAIRATTDLREALRWLGVESANEA